MKVIVVLYNSGHARMFYLSDKNNTPNMDQHVCDKT